MWWLLIKSSIIDVIWGFSVSLTTFALHWGPSRVSNLIIQPWCLVHHDIFKTFYEHKILIRIRGHPCFFCENWSILIDVAFKLQKNDNIFLIITQIKDYMSTILNPAWKSSIEDSCTSSKKDFVYLQVSKVPN